MQKDQLLDFVKSRVEAKIQNLDEMIAGIRNSGSETKSSMGDKYETALEMQQQEINNLQLQRADLLSKQNELKNIKINENSLVENGALVETKNGFFFICVSEGQISFQGKKIYCISMKAPFSQAIKGKKAGEIFSVNGRSETILKVW